MNFDALGKLLEGEVILIIGLFGAFMFFLGWLVWGRRTGNGGESADCCVCGTKGNRLVPVITGSWADSAFARSRRLNGIPLSYRVLFDDTDPRRLCTPCQRVRVEKLETWCDETRARHVAFNRAQWETLPSAFDGVRASAPETALVERKPFDSSIELDIGGATQ